MLVLRDFEKITATIIVDQGYFKIDMPESHIIEIQVWHSYEEFTKTLSLRSLSISIKR
jgi:hypothetical protein